MYLIKIHFYLYYLQWRQLGRIRTNTTRFDVIGDSIKFWCISY